MSDIPPNKEWMNAPPNKEWMNARRVSPQFVNGVASFIKFTKDNLGGNGVFYCPCRKCQLYKDAKIPLQEVHGHLLEYGVDNSYRIWIHHGEQPASNVFNVGQVSNLSASNVYGEDSGPRIVDMFSDLHRNADLNHNLEDCIHDATQEDGVNVVSDPSVDINYKKRLDDSLQPLYPSCRGQHTKLSTTVELLSMKARHNCTDAFLTELLEFMRSILPAGNTLPESANKAKAMIKPFRMKCEIIHACINDCILYRKDYADLNECPNCVESRWKPKDKNKPRGKQVARKKLRYFPVTERLQRMYLIPWIAELMNWHANVEESNTHMRHPVDSSCWKKINNKWPEFSDEKRNVRLGLATDGFNPFGMNNPHSCWPVMMVPFNLPPSLCMSKEFTMLTLLIPGPSEPGHDIDVYLQPLVDELKELWSTGKLTYDSHTKTNFTMKAMLMWCVHDFPAYGHVSGCRTAGKFGCPVCGESTDSKWLKNGRKYAYMGHRRFLRDVNHPFRKQKSQFNGSEEHGTAPKRLTGDQLLPKMNGVRTEFGKFTCKGKTTTEANGSQVSSTSRKCMTSAQLIKNMQKVQKGCGSITGKRKRSVNTSIPNQRKRTVDTSTPWSKRSVFFELPYWMDLPVRHNVDVMHVEKNFAENLFGTVMDNKEKTKDGITARKDLKLWKIKKKLWLKDLGNGKVDMPRAAYCLPKEERILVCITLSNLKVPIGYSGSWKKKVCLREFQFKNLKSHDYHILMQGLLPVFLMYCFKNARPLREAIRQVSLFFKVLCSKVIDRNELAIMHGRLVEALCVFEIYFPPSFFVTMTHVVVHLAEEALILGPVACRWMYPFERMMRTYKVFGRNMNYIEGSIADQYSLRETLKDCMGYIPKGKEKCYKKRCSDTGEGPYPRKSKGKSYSLPNTEYEQARRWVLKHSEENTEWEAKYEAYVESFNSMSVRGRMDTGKTDDYIKWLRKQLLNEEMTEFKRLVDGPERLAISYNAYSINGYIFYTAEAEQNLSTQNSGVAMNARTTFRASAKDRNTVDDDAAYFGIIIKIIELDYVDFTQTVFYCDWVRTEDKVHGCYVEPETNLTYVNLERFMRNTRDDDEPVIHSSQASQVFYCKDESKPDSKWHIVLESPKRPGPNVNSYEDPYVFTGNAGEAPPIPEAVVNYWEEE